MDTRRQKFKMTEELTDDSQEGFTLGRGCVDQIFTSKQLNKKTEEKKQRGKQVS